MSGSTPTRDELESYRLEARAWLEQEPHPELPEKYEDRAPVLRAWHRRLYEAGWVGIHWPTTYGGRGLSAQHHIVFGAELARSGAPQPVGSIGLEVAGPTILKFGTEEQRRRFIPPLLSGEEVWCQGFSEPDAGSDLASLRTRGVIEGDELVINGQKVWTSWATNADWCALLVRTGTTAERHRGITYVLVDMRTPGITVRPIVMLNGDAEFNELFFEDVRVPLDQVLGTVGGGWPLAMDTLGWERAGYSIRRRIEIEIAFGRLVEQLKSSGIELSGDDVRRLGEVQAQLKAFESLSERTADRLASGDVPSPLDSVDKLVLTETEQAVTGLSFDLLGWRRMTPDDHEDSLRTKAFLYGRAASVYGGSSQIQKALIAERHLGLPRGR